MLEALRQEIYQLHMELPRNNLVTWTVGNLSGRDPETGLVVIKPSGVRYEALSPAHMIVLTVDGEIVEGDLKPSSDAATHLYIYRHRPDVNGVVHTHSPYATAFAAVGMPIPVVLTAMCDEFGGPIPVGGFEPIGHDEIGQEVVRAIGDSCAILMQNHGPFTIGRTPEAALKAAVMVEDAAKTVWLAMQIGQPLPIPDDLVARLHRRYTEEYGQGETRE